MTPHPCSPSGPKSSRRPVVVYFHRYPPETEAVQNPSTPAILRRLSEKYDTVYLSMKGTGPPEATIRAGIRVLELPWQVDQSNAHDKWIKTGLYYVALPWVLRRLRKEAPDLIMCREILPGIPARVARATKGSVVVAASDWWLSIFLGGTRWGQMVADVLERREVATWRRRGLWAMVNTETERQRLAQKGFPLERIRVIHAPFNPGVFGPCDALRERVALGLDSSHWVLATHGIIRPGKGYGQLLRWWKAVAERHPNWRLLIIGGAGGESWCRRQVQRLGLISHVIFTGWLPTKTDVNRHLNAADALLVVRRNSPENWGIVPSALYNSLATGKPTVVAGLPAMAEIVRHGREGYVYRPDDFASFLSVLEAVASDRQTAARIGEQGRRRACECFDPESSAAATVAFVEQILQTGPATRAGPSGCEARPTTTQPA